MFNLGVSRMLTRNHVGAVVALEQSLKLDAWNTMAMVYLGQARALNISCIHLSSSYGNGTKHATLKSDVRLRLFLFAGHRMRA